MNNEMVSSPMKREQEALIEAFAAGDMGSVEFFELALEAGLSLAEIEDAMAEGEDC